MQLLNNLHTRYRIICTFLILTLLVDSLFGQKLTDTLQIKTVEIVASRIVVKEESGQTSTRIDSLAMTNALTVSLADLISRNTPIFIKEYGRGAMATASFRGTAPSHTQVQWNGIDLNSPMLGMVDFSMIPVYFTDDVSLLHGSASLKNSGGALGGAIQLDNKTNWSNTFSGKILSGIGSYASFDEFIQLNLGNRKIQSQTRAFFNQSANDFSFLNKFIADIDPETGNYIYPTQKNLNADYRNYGFLQELYLHPSSNDYLSARYWFQHNERSIPQLLTNETAENANINRQIEDAHRSVLEWKRFLEKGFFSVNSGFNYQISGYRLKTKISGSDDQNVIDSHSKSFIWSNRFSYTYQPNESFSLISGAAANLSAVNSRNEKATTSEVGYNKKRWDSSLFAQFSKILNHRWNASLILRQEFANSKATAFLPLAGLEFRPFTEKDFYFKSSIARNFHQPTLNDLYYLPGGNPDLKPEKGTMVDLGAGGSLIKGQTEFNYSVNSYLSSINNWIIWLPTYQGYWEPYNMKKVDTRGVEFNIGIKGKLNQLSYQANGNYAFTRTINHDNPRNWADESIGKQLPYIPLHSANFTTHLSAKNYYCTWVWNYYSERFTTSSNDKETKLETLYPYFMNNLSLGKTIAVSDNKDRFNIELKINNIFNEDYRTVLQRPMPRRNYSLLIRFDF